MGPRTRGRRNRQIMHDEIQTALLQWGRAHGDAETIKQWFTLKDVLTLQWDRVPGDAETVLDLTAVGPHVASMGPRPRERGYSRRACGE